MRALVAASALLLAACTSTSAPEPVASPVAAEPTSGWSVELSTAPTLLAVGETDVHVASYGNGVGGSQVYRVDRATGVLEEQRTLAGQPHGMVLGPDGKLWVATLRLPDQPTGTGLQVLDGETLQTQRVVDVEEVPLSLAVVGDDLWVGASEGVRRYDDGSGALGPLVPTSTPAYRMLADAGGLLVVGPSAVERVDVESGAAQGSLPVPASGSVSATGHGDAVWLVYPDAQAAAVLQRVDPATLQPAVTAPSPGRAGVGAAVTGEALWIADPGAQEVRCADLATGEVLSTTQVPRATGAVAADEQQVFVGLRDGLAAVPADC